MDDFDKAYDSLSRIGKCDSLGGCEWRRVKTEWISVGCPSHVDSFIVIAANIPAVGVGRLEMN